MLHMVILFLLNTPRATAQELLLTESRSRRCRTSEQKNILCKWKQKLLGFYQGNFKIECTSHLGVVISPCHDAEVSSVHLKGDREKTGRRLELTCNPFHDQSPAIPHSASGCLTGCAELRHFSEREKNSEWFNYHTKVNLRPIYLISDKASNLFGIHATFFSIKWKFTVSETIYEIQLLGINW